MNETNYPQQSPITPVTPRKNLYHKMIIVILLINIAGAWVYHFMKNNEKIVTIEKIKKEYVIVDSTKNLLQETYNAALIRLDSLAGSNKSLTASLTKRNKEINKLKTHINQLLEKERLTQEEMNEAVILITSLNSKIGVMEEEVNNLKKENTQLVADLSVEKTKNSELNVNLNQVVTKNTELESKVNVASTLNITDIKITPVKEKASGKEVEVSKSKKVDKLVISFDVFNRIYDKENADLFICIKNPNGKHMGPQNTLVTNKGDVLYTSKVVANIVPYEKNQVTYDLRSMEFIPGKYSIEIYHNGFKIGQKDCELKKSWL